MFTKSSEAGAMITTVQIGSASGGYETLSADPAAHTQPTNSLAGQAEVFIPNVVSEKGTNRDF